MCPCSDPIITGVMVTLVSLLKYKNVSLIKVEHQTLSINRFKAENISGTSLFTYCFLRLD